MCAVAALLWPIVKADTGSGHRPSEVCLALLPSPGGGSGTPLAFSPSGMVEGGPQAHPQPLGGQGDQGMKATGQAPPWPPGRACSPQRPIRDFGGTVGKRESLFPLRWLETKEAGRPPGHWREGSSLRWSLCRADGGGHSASRPLGPAPATHPQFSDPQTTGTVPPQPQFCLTQFEVEF